MRYSGERPIANVGPARSRQERLLDEALDRMAAAGELIRARGSWADVEDFEPVRLRKPPTTRRGGKTGSKRALTASQIIIQVRG